MYTALDNQPVQSDKKDISLCHSYFIVRKVGNVLQKYVSLSA